MQNTPSHFTNEWQQRLSEWIRPLLNVKLYGALLYFVVLLGLLVYASEDLLRNLLAAIRNVWFAGWAGVGELVRAATCFLLGTVALFVMVQLGRKLWTGKLAQVHLRQEHKSPLAGERIDDVKGLVGVSFAVQ